MGLPRNKEPIQKAIARVLRRVASTIESLSEDELAAVLRGRFELNVDSGRSRASKPKSLGVSKESLSSETLSLLERRLRAAESRDQGFAILTESVVTRRDLEMLARHLGLPVERRDNRERLTDRIIEGTIGFRLRSAAIQGTAEVREKRPDE